MVDAPLGGGKTKCLSFLVREIDVVESSIQMIIENCRKLFNISDENSIIIKTITKTKYIEL